MSGTDATHLVGLALSSGFYAETILSRVAPDDLGGNLGVALAAIGEITEDGGYATPQQVASRAPESWPDPLVLVNMVERAVAADGLYRNRDDVVTLCDRVVSAARRRRLTAIAGEIADGVRHEHDPSEIVERASGLLSAFDDEADDGMPLDVDSWIAEAPEREWIVEGLIARLDRLLLVAGEGGGKSTLFRQVAMCVSQGIHPWHFHAIPPVNVLLVDLENPPTIARQQFAALRDATVRHAQRRNETPTLDEEHDAPFPAFDPRRLRIEARPEGIDVTHRVDARWLLRKVAAAKPDLVVIGPVYKLHESEEEKSSDVRQVLKILDRIRTRWNCALWMETHAPHESFRRDGDLRPAGSRLWLRWPEFVLTLAPRSAAPDAEWVVGHARPPRDQRQFPRFLNRGGEAWPWEPWTL